MDNVKVTRDELKMEFMMKRIDKLAVQVNALEERLSRQHKESLSKPILHRVANCKAVNVRMIPSPDGQNIGYLYKGDIVYVYAKEKNWYQIDSEGKRWVYGDYLEQAIIK